MRISAKIACLTALHVGLTRQPKSDETGLGLTIWVENWAEVEPLILASAEKAAGKIFHNSGIKVNWRETSALLSPPEQGGTNLLLRISRSKDFGYRNRRWDSGGSGDRMTFEPLCSSIESNSLRDDQMRVSRPQRFLDAQ